MKRTLLAGSALAVLSAVAQTPASAQQKTIKIGFISTFGGPVAVIGNDMRNSFELALDHLGRKTLKLDALEVLVLDEVDAGQRRSRQGDVVLETPSQDGTLERRRRRPPDLGDVIGRMLQRPVEQSGT